MPESGPGPSHSRATLAGDNGGVLPASPGFRAYAHRGGAHEAPENSLTAFRRASELGYVHLETDVRPTRDGVAVLHHDAGLDRTTDSRGPVRQRSWRELASVRLADGSTPLRLEELLEDIPTAHLNIDVKESGSVIAVADALRRTQAWGRVCVTSFSARRLGRARRMMPPNAESSAHPWEVLALRALPRRVALPGITALPRVQRVQVPVRAFGVTLAEPGFIRRAQARGLAVDVWTVNDRPSMEALLDLGVDGIMTDAPTVLREVLVARGSWPA